MKKLTLLYSLASLLIAQCPTLPALATLPPNGLASKPPMGWNTWYGYGGSFTDAIVRANADAVVSSGMRAAGYQYINLDDLWQGGRDGGGNIISNPAKIPDMAAMTAYIHSIGLKAGIYSGPGTTTCGGAAGSFLHEAQDATQYAAWGFDFFKYDLCGATAVYTAASCTFTRQQIWQFMAQNLRATGRDMVYSISDYGASSTIAKAAGANMVRIGQDVATTWASWHDTGFGALGGYTGGVGNAPPGFWADPDMMPIGQGGTTDEDKAVFSNYAIRSAPMIVSNNLTTMSATTRDILINSEVISVDQDALGIEGVAVSTVGATYPTGGAAVWGTSQVWAKQLSDGWAVALFNLSTSPLSVASTWSMFGQAGGFFTRDLWAHSNLGFLTGYTTVVPAHGVSMLKLTSTPPPPPSSLVSGKAKIGGGRIQ